MSQGPVPDPVRNVFRDMRDRKMLPLVALLIVAIIAIPILLSQDPAGPPPASTASSADVAANIEGTEIADPVVLTEVPGIRAYQERLDSLQESNPFKQQLTGSPKLEQETAKLEKGVEKALEDVVAEADAGGTAGNEPETTTPEDPGAAEDGGEKTFLVFWEIDAKVGVVGEGKKKTGIKQLEFLPGKSHPVVQFIEGIGESAAIFIVSRSVGDTHGEGRCQPGRNDCQFLKLKVGEAHTFRYEPNGLQYRIKLTDVHLLQKEIDPDNPKDFERSESASKAAAAFVVDR